MLFDRIKSGYPGADEVFDSIRIGGNVVWQVSDLAEYRLFARPFAEQAMSDGRNVVCIHFTRHEPLLTARPGLKISEFDPDVGFEPFSVAIYERIPAEGKGEEVLEGVNAFVEQQKQSFQQYLADQYDIASAAKVETLEDGTVLLVMCEDQDTVLESIKTALNG